MHGSKSGTDADTAVALKPPRSGDPACASAASTAARLAALGGVIGRRSSVGKSGPDLAQRIFDRAGRGVGEQGGVERIEPVLQRQRIVPAPFRGTPSGNRRRARGATLAVTEMQPTPPIAMKPSAMSSLPESWMKSLPQASALGGDAGGVAGRVLDADHGRAVWPVRAIVSTLMSTIVRAGTL